MKHGNLEVIHIGVNDKMIIENKLLNFNGCPELSFNQPVQ